MTSEYAGRGLAARSDAWGALAAAVLRAACASMGLWAAVVAGPACSSADDVVEPSAPNEHSMIVKATAYTSTRAQTDDQPNVAAWGDALAPGMKSIAVSRDLLAMGLGRGVEVEIEGLEGTYRVLDKMAKRWRQKIDIYMGDDIRAARQWGIREVRIRWLSPRAAPSHGSDASR